MRPSRFLAAALGVGVALAAGAAPASAAPGATPGAPGLGDRLYPLLGNGGYDVGNYDLHLTYPAKDPAQQITGDVVVSAVATQSLSRFDLDFGGDAVGTVTVDGRRATYTRDGDELVITPARPIANHHRFTVTVAGFTATPIPPNADTPAGFIKTPDGTVLAGQPDTSHKLFPSNDHPRDKATYTIALTVPDGWTTVANGVKVASVRRGGRTTSVFRENNPMASELVQVVAGDFVVKSRPAAGGVPIRDVVPTRLQDSLLPILADEPNAITWMQQQVGKYPFEDYGSLVIDGVLGFALETQTLSLYDTYFTQYPQGDFNAVSTHELSHQWFGDSVAPYEWSDVWLNEGHASWYEVQYADHTGITEEYTGYPTLDDYFKAVYGNANIRRAQYGPVAHPNDAITMWDVFNPNVYSGGALVLYALRQQVGDAAFRQIERTWVTTYKGRSASTGDYIDLASRVSHQDLHAFLTNWLYGSTVPPMPGHPDWTAKPVTTTALSKQEPARVDVLK